jgi:hypothetical protein
MFLQFEMFLKIKLSLFNAYYTPDVDILQEDNGKITPNVT